MQVTPEIFFAVLGGAFVVGGLIWKGATKLTSIESKVDKALEWIAEQKSSASHASPRKKAARK